MMINNDRGLGQVNKSLKIIFSVIGLLFALQFVLILILYNRYSVSATRNFLDQDMVSSMSSERAKEIALDYIHPAIAKDVTLVSEGHVPIYAVKIKYENFHYVVYVDGETGKVLWLTRSDVEGDGM